MQNIAKHLNVSVSTVSRVVNNLNHVDPETRKRVSRALNKFNFQPNENARRLKTNISNVIGVIVPDISNPFYASVIKGIESIMAEKGYLVILYNTNDNKDREKHSLELLVRQKVAGIIVATIFCETDVLKYYSALNCPVIFFDNVPSKNMPTYSVTIDNTLATMQLVAYMIAQGHRRIFMITGPYGVSSANERLLGWKMALHTANIIPENDWFIHGDFREESGQFAMNEFLQRDKPPTAVCVANNFMAYGAIKSIFNAGLLIPNDISIGAFDIVDTTGLMNLDITTIIEPAEDIGVIAADLCLQSNDKESIKLSRKTILEHYFNANSTIRKI